jgi:hypothetical protein
MVPSSERPTLELPAYGTPEGPEAHRRMSPEELLQFVQTRMDEMTSQDFIEAAILLYNFLTS